MDASALVREHQAAVYRYCRTLTRSDQAAEDALQETFLAAIKGLDGFRGDASPRTWLLAIARRVVFRSRRLRVGEPESYEPLSELGARAGWGETTPEAMVQRREERAVLDRALTRLKADDREVLLLRDLEDLDVGEAAEVMDLPAATVRVRHHRARLRLMAAVQEEVNDGEGT